MRLHGVFFLLEYGVTNRCTWSCSFKIEDEEKFGADHLAAWACIKLDRLGVGYRLIRLIDAQGVASSGRLLVKIEVKRVACQEKSLLARTGPVGLGKPVVHTVV
jgi:hypothetical protein